MPPVKPQRSSLSKPCLMTLRIELTGITPAIWREITIDGRSSFEKLHHVIQAAMGWHDAHLHEFCYGERRIGVPDTEGLDEGLVENEKKLKLNRLFVTGDTFIYMYDFGDSWEHLVSVENINEDVDQNSEGIAWIKDGARACPPEDVGGAFEYENFLDVLQNDPMSEEGLRYREWAGSDFDPEHFDRRAANAAIERMLWNRWVK